MGPGMVEVGAAEVVVPPAKRRRVVALKSGATTAAGQRPRRGKKPTAIQRLFQACRTVFRAPVPCPRPPRSPCSAPCSCTMVARSSRNATRSDDHHRGDAFSELQERVRVARPCRR